MDALAAGFADPPRSAGPWVYWFWFDGVLARDELARQLEELATAGIAGAEIRCITFHGWGGPPLEHMDETSLERLGHERVEYLSDEFLDLLAFACERAEALGLELAINMGQGWPPGGPWITDEHRSRHLVSTAHVVEERQGFRAEVEPGTRAFGWRLAGEEGSVVQGTFLDLSELAGEPDGELRWSPPEGRWLVGLFTERPGGICDKGEGPEVDPASARAVRFHLEHLFGRLDPRLERFYGTTLVDVASDSWEYARGPGRYWSREIPEAFQEQLGYDLFEHAHVLLGHGPGVESVLADLAAVERELVHESFLRTARELLHERGLGHRPQLYGRGLERDLLEAYTLTDTPEIEQGIVLPDAVWAAHVAGLPVVSAEAFTFLSGKHEPVGVRNGPWRTTPALLSLHANHLFAEGINRIQFHSYSYSPPELPLPGWRMYAEIHLNGTVPWWWAMPELTRWMRRNQWLLQAGHPVADALVYPVLASPIDRPFDVHAGRQPITARNAVDGAHAPLLPLLRESLAEGRYDLQNLVVLDGAELPDIGARVSVVQPKTSLDETLEALASVRFAPGADIAFLHRRVGEGELYFLVNRGEPFEGVGSFPHADGLVELWDADHGSVRPAGQLVRRAGHTDVPLRLGHFESLAVSFRPGTMPVHVCEASSGAFAREAERGLVGTFDRGGRHELVLSDGTRRQYHLPELEPLEVEGPWSLTGHGLTLDELLPWRHIPALRTHAGTVTYSVGIDLDPERLAEGRAWQLELGRVFEVARVRVNGKPAGLAWRPPCRIDVTQLLRDGANTIEIDVANLLQNRLDPTVGYDRPSGLLGPVLLVPEHRVVLDPDS